MFKEILDEFPKRAPRLEIYELLNKKKYFTRCAVDTIA